MKTRIALFALTVGVFVVTGCAGTQVAVDRFGNMQPDIQRFEPSVNTNVVESETRPLFMPDNQFGVFSMFGFNDFQARQMPMTFEFPHIFGGSLSLINGTQLMQNPMQVVFLYNQDASLTLFRFSGFQIKVMPMMNGGF